jgi:hypothetical protein
MSLALVSGFDNHTSLIESPISDLTMSVPCGVSRIGDHKESPSRIHLGSSFVHFEATS